MPKPRKRLPYPWPAGGHLTLSPYPDTHPNWPPNEKLRTSINFGKFFISQWTEYLKRWEVKMIKKRKRRRRRLRLLTRSLSSVRNIFLGFFVRNQLSWNRRNETAMWLRFYENHQKLILVQFLKNLKNLLWRILKSLFTSFSDLFLSQNATCLRPTYTVIITHNTKKSFEWKKR